MKTKQTFQNASLRTVNNGYIEIDVNGVTTQFHNASVISVKDGNIIIEHEWKIEEGDIVKIKGNGIDAYVIYKHMTEREFHNYGYLTFNHGIWRIVKPGQRDVFLYDHHAEISPITLQEIEEFDNFFIAQAGKIWNKETLSWKSYKWIPKVGEDYYYVNDEVCVSRATFETAVHWHQKRVDGGNCFRTKALAECALSKFKMILGEY